MARLVGRLGRGLSRWLQACRFHSQQLHAERVPATRLIPGSCRQKKRVTSGEALAGHARVLYADEISTGLDSNTTYQITKSLRNICHVMNVSSAVCGGWSGES